MAASPGFLMPLKSLLVRALKEVFDDEYPNPDFRGLHVGMEFPDEQQHYPGVWVDFEPAGTVFNAGVDHRERALNNAGTYDEIFRWRFQGQATYTLAVVETIAVRDSLFDELASVMAFGQGDPIKGRFRALIEDNPLIGIDFDWGELGWGGFATQMATPWGTSEMIHEATLRVECQGEFTSNRAGELQPLQGVEFETVIDTDLSYVAGIEEEPVAPLDPDDGWV